MRSILCVLVVGLFATTAAAQLGQNGGVRSTARTADAAQRKTAAEKGHTERPAKVSAAELAAAETELANKILAAMDADGDGVVTKVEYGKALASLRRVPKDPKGNMVVPDKAAADPNAAAANGLNPGLGQGPGGVGAPATGDARENNEAMGLFTRYDTNHDGMLSPEEVPAQSRAMLREADVNQDGVIDAKEFQVFGRKMGERMKAFNAGVNPNGANGNGRNPKP